MNKRKEPEMVSHPTSKVQEPVKQQDPAPIDAATASFLRRRAEAAAQGRDPFARPRRAVPAPASAVVMSR